MNLMHLKSGTDIRGTADLKDGGLSDEVLSGIIAAFVKLLESKLRLEAQDMIVSVGHDSRLSSKRIKKTIIKTLQACGVNVYDCSLSSTPAMFLTCVHLSCDAAIQITASHHPKDKNGLKFFTEDGGFASEDIEYILKKAPEHMTIPFVKPGFVESIDFMSQYSLMLRDMICEGVNSSEDYHKPLKDMHIIVDAGNGVGGFYAKRVLESLGANIEGSQFLEPDGNFPNHIPNPEDENAMMSISRAVTENKADFGIIFDTDVDRAACVGHDGKEINKNRLIALASAIVLENHKGGTIVTDSITSDGLKTFIEKDLGGVHHRYKRGYKNVIDEAKRLNAEGIDCPLAIETSGHAAMRENHFLDDGAYLITKILIKFAKLRNEGRTLNELIKNLEEPTESKEIRINILEKDFKAYAESIIEDLHSYAKTKKGWDIAKDSHEGIRIAFDSDNGGGWLLLRLSVHDPVLPLNVESSQNGGTNKILSAFYDFIKGYDNLDIDNLESALK